MTIQIIAFALWFSVVMLILLHKVVLTFESVDEKLMCDHSNYRFCSVFFCNNVNYVAPSGSYILVCG